MSHPGTYPPAVVDFGYPQQPETDGQPEYERAVHTKAVGTTIKSPSARATNRKGMMALPPAQAPPASATVTATAHAPIDGWSSGLCDCTQDCKSCLVTCCCGCVAHGMVQSRVDGSGAWCPPCCIFVVLSQFCYAHLWLLGTVRRATVRAKYSLPEEPCSDCCVGCCCSPCAICQEWRELDRRGVPPAQAPC